MTKTVNEELVLTTSLVVDKLELILNGLMQMQPQLRGTDNFEIYLEKEALLNAMAYTTFVDENVVTTPEKIETFLLTNELYQDLLIYIAKEFKTPLEENEDLEHEPYLCCMNYNPYGETVVNFHKLDEEEIKYLEEDDEDD